MAFSFLVMAGAHFVGDVASVHCGDEYVYSSKCLEFSTVLDS